jgi:hypothetical protein
LRNFGWLDSDHDESGWLGERLPLNRWLNALREAVSLCKHPSVTSFALWTGSTMKSWR